MIYASLLERHNPLSFLGRLLAAPAEPRGNVTWIRGIARIMIVEEVLWEEEASNSGVRTSVVSDPGRETSQWQGCWCLRI
jgi:hypothetical protein